MGVWFQVVCTMIICTLGINMGLLFTWPAGTLKLFGSENTTLSRPMTEIESSLFGSLSSIGGLLSNPLSALLLDKLGRKKCTLITAIGVVLTWSIIVSTNRVEVILTGVFVSGVISSVIMVCSIYTSEICQESIRGAMTSGVMVSFGIGILMSYTFAGYLDYYTNTYVGLTSSVVGVGLVFLLKESPTHLMAVGKEKEAAEAIAYYKRLKISSKVVQEEIAKIKRSLNPELDDKTPEEQRLKPEQKPKEKLSIWQFLRKSQSSRRALFVNMVLVTAAIFQGLIVLQIHADTLFSQAIPDISSTICSIVLASVIVLAGLATAYLTESAGRRPLMIYSSFGVGLCCIVLGTQIHLHWGPSWVTGISLLLFPIVYTFGAGTVPFVLLAELFLPEIRGFATMLIMEWMWLCSFVVLFIFTPVMKLIGLGPLFYIFGGVCFFTSWFSYFFLPETKGLTVDVIQELFTKKRKRHCLY